MNTLICVTAIAAAFFALDAKVIQAQDKPIVRRIDFRDGSSFLAVLPNQQMVWKNIAKDGKVTERKVSLKELKQLTLVKEPSTARVAKIRNLLSQLGSEDYHERINAQIRLTESGKEFEKIIEQYVPDDEETKWRIAKVKEHLKEETGPSKNDSTFDVLVLEGAESQLDGELDLQQFDVKYGNATIRVSRDKVAAITDEPLQANFVLSGAAGGGKRSQDYPDANGTMPVGMTYIGFEQLPGGKEMSGGMDVSKAYAARGVLFSTSYKESYVGTQMYTFTDGRGGNYSIANFEPTYQGVITLSFCVPGNELFAAGTKYVGFNVSHVNPDGTFFEAYDAQGQLITKFTTDDSGTDYLGFASEVPIAKVVVRPNVEVDEDFAIDDLFFATPVALLESGNPDYFSVVTRKGERLQAEKFSVSGANLILEKLSFGADSVSVSIDDIWVMISAKDALKTFANDSMNNYCYCLGTDGSIVLADPGNQKSLRFKDEINGTSIVALWGIQNQLTTPPSFKVGQGDAAVFSHGQYFDLVDFKFGKNWLESPSIAELAKKKEGADEDNNEMNLGVDLTKTNYVNSNCVYFRVPAEISPKVGVVYTYDGERYFIGEKYCSVKVTSDSVEVSKGAKSAKLGWDEIRSLRLPKE